MKIAIIGYMGWYGSMAEQVADSFVMLGDSVVKFDRNSTIVIPDDVDFVMVIDSSEDYSANIPDCKQIKVFWSMDAHMPGGAERSCNMARRCDYTFSSNYEHGVKVLEKFGIESHLMPITYNKSFVDCQDDTNFPDFDIDVSMIGNKNSQQRVELWHMLNTKFKSFCGVAGTLDEYKSVMSTCKVVVNQPTEPFDIILNNRFFEALGWNRILLQKRLQTDLIEKMGFVDGVDFIYWSNFEELEALLHRIIDCDFGTESFKYVDMAKSGYDKVQRYAMHNQCQKIKDIILSEFYNSL